MNNDTYIGIYWKGSKNNLPDANKLISNTLTFLSTVDKSCESWLPTSRPKKGEMIYEIQNTNESISVLIEKGLIKNDDDETQLDLGTIICLKSEKSYEKSNVLTFSCGNNSIISVPNSVVLSINSKNSDLLEIKNLFKIFLGFINIWKPDHGLINKHSNKNTLTGENFDFGLITFSENEFQRFDKNLFHVEQLPIGSFLFENRLINDAIKDLLT